MKINSLGSSIIKSFEGCKLTPYLDAIKIPTIGYGCTIYPNDKKVSMTDAPISLNRANELLQLDLLRFEVGVSRLVTSAINENQYSALVSFAFNLGLESLRKSTLLKLVNADPNDHNIAMEFKKWINAGGKPLEGLKRRRAAEAELYQRTV